MSSVKSVKAVNTPDWYELLMKAVLEPALLQQAHKSFRQYSLGNQWLAATQLIAKGSPIQPINTYKGWLEAGRQVQRGEKASVKLVMPVPVRSKKKKEGGEEEDVQFMRFILRNYWFSLDQTKGDEYEPQVIEDGDWNISSVMHELGIQERDYAFESISLPGSESYTKDKSIHISPLAADQNLARIREISRTMLGHYDSKPSSRVPSDLVMQGIEAEAVTYLVAATLGLENIETVRAKMQEHLAEGNRDNVPMQVANRAFSTADKIINAGYC